MRTLAAQLRDPRTGARREYHLDEIDRLGGGGFTVSLLIIASAQRNGYLREPALLRLTAHPGRLALAALLGRLNDPVPRLRQLAGDHLAARVATAPVWDVLRCLPTIEGLAELRHTASSPIADQALRRLTDPALLLPSLSDPRDPDLRLAVLRRLGQLCAGSEAIGPALRRALGDPDPVIRRTAASMACSRSVTPRAVRDGLLSTMAADRSPQIRQLALRARIRQGRAEEALTAAAFDANAGTRFLARRHLQRRQIPVAYREQAAAILKDSAASRAAVIGALAVLSDLGGEADQALVARFAEDDRPSVRREALRTLAVLA